MIKFDKRLLLAIIPLLLISTTTIAYAMITIYSPVRKVDIQYQLALTTSLSGSITTLTATLTNVGAPVANVPIKFYHCDSAGIHTGGNATALATVQTNTSGIAVWNQGETSNGIYYYIAEFTTA